MSNRTYSDFVFLPYTKDAFFALTENLAKRLKEDTNGQFNRKPSWLGHRIVESLPNKPDGFNRHTLLDEMRLLAESSSQTDTADENVKPADTGYERVPATGLKSIQDPMASFSESLDTREPIKLPQMIDRVKLTKSLGELKHFFKGVDAGHHEKLVLNELHAVSEACDLHEACNLIEEGLLSNDFYRDNSGYVVAYLNDTLVRLIDGYSTEDAKAIHELNQCVVLLTSKVKQLSHKGEKTVHDSLSTLITENPQYKFELMQIAKNIAETNNTFDICEDTDEPDGFNWTVYWGLSESMSFKSKMGAVLFTADKCLNVEGSYHYNVDHRHGSCVSKSAMNVKLRTTLDLLHVIGAAHLATKEHINAKQYIGFNSVEDMCAVVERNKDNGRTIYDSASKPISRKERTKPLSALNAYLLKTFTDNVLKEAVSEAISTAIVDAVDSDSEFGEDIYNKANEDSNGTLGDRTVLLEKQLKLELSNRKNSELRQDLMTWAASPLQAEIINEVHSNFLSDYEHTLPFSEQQFIVAVIAAKERLIGGLYGALQEIGASCFQKVQDADSAYPVIKKALNGEYILHELTKFIYEGNYVVLD